MKIEQDELTIYEVETLHKDLLDAFKKGNVTVDMVSVHKIDMSVIQLFLSLQKSAVEELKSFEIINVTSEVKQIMQNAACTSLLFTGDSNE